uniref:Uncharacterized protein n=1 Tax=Arundo donax TaxID=35708 RepID=A0A0A9TH11_ARUDO
MLVLLFDISILLSVGACMHKRSASISCCADSDGSNFPIGKASPYD